MTRLNGRVAIVTGAAQGIGATYAKILAAESAKVVLADIQDTCQAVAVIRQAGGEAIGITANVTDDISLAEMASVALSAYGRIDIVVTNAAIYGNLVRKPFEKITLEEWDDLSRVNIRGVWQTIKAVTPQMRAQKYGKVITIASSTAFKGTSGFAHYVASKGAVIAMTRALARELGDDNICVNCIAPGLTMSDAMRKAEQSRGPIFEANIATRSFKRAQEPDDIGGALLFLASSDSDFVTGQTLIVDGGSSMH